MLRVFIGYDEGEKVAYHVCAESIIEYASEPVAITPLKRSHLKRFTDAKTDGSNAFTYSRFLVPWLCRFEGYAVFLDGDMIVKDDIAKLFALADGRSAVQVVKHDYQTKHPVKYRGAGNPDYPRKNWSSVVLWNCASFLNRALTPEFISEQTGQYLHRFGWIPDDRIGELPVEWNWLVSEYPQRNDVSLLHYTIGVPCFSDYALCDNAGAWHAMKAEAMSHTEYGTQADARLQASGR